MGDEIKDAAVWLAAGLKANCGESVTYQRGALTVSVTATIGQTAYRVDDLPRGKSKLEHSDADFTFTVADLTTLGITMPPLKGDTITYGGQVYTATNINGERCYWLDGFVPPVQVTVHTKRTQ